MKRWLKKLKPICEWYVKRDLIAYFAIVGPIVVGTLPWILLEFGVYWPILRGAYGAEPSFRPNEVGSLGIPLFVGMLATLWLFFEKWCYGSLGRMRHVIAILILTGVAVLSWTTYAWMWLSNGNESNSATIRDIGLAIAAVLTLVFVIWRERIASSQASTARNRAETERVALFLEHFSKRVSNKSLCYPERSMSP